MNFRRWVTGIIDAATSHASSHERPVGISTPVKPMRSAARAICCSRDRPGGRLLLCQDSVHHRGWVKPEKIQTHDFFLQCQRVARCVREYSPALEPCGFDKRGLPFAAGERQRGRQPVLWWWEDGGQDRWRSPVQAGPWFCQQRDALLTLALGQRIGLREGIQHPLNKGAIFLSVRTCRRRTNRSASGWCRLSAPHTAPQQCGGVVRIPDSPASTFLLKRRARIGRRQVNGLDIGEF